MKTDRRGIDVLRDVVHGYNMLDEAYKAAEYDIRRIAKAMNCDVAVPSRYAGMRLVDVMIAVIKDAGLDAHDVARASKDKP